MDHCLSLEASEGIQDFDFYCHGERATKKANTNTVVHLLRQTGLVEIEMLGFELNN